MSSSFAQPPATGRPSGDAAAGPFGLFVIFSLHFWPRACLFFFWLFSDLVGRAIESSVVCVLGFLLAPWTTFTYAVMWSISSNEVTGWEWIVVGLAVLLDLMAWGGLRQVRR